MEVFVESRAVLTVKCTITAKSAGANRCAINSVDGQYGDAQFLVCVLSYLWLMWVYF